MKFCLKTISMNNKNIDSIVKFFEELHEKCTNQEEKFFLDEVPSFYSYTKNVSQMGYWCMHRKTKRIYVNKAWNVLTGNYTGNTGSLLLDDLHILAHPEDLKKLAKITKDIFDGKTDASKFEMVFRIKSSKGDWKSLILRGKGMITDENNVSIYTFGTVLDMTEILKGEVIQQEILSTIKNLHKNLPGMVYEYKIYPDGSWGMPYVSENVVDLYGFDEEYGKLNPNIFIDIVHPEDREIFSTSLPVPNIELPMWANRFRILHPTKGVRWIDAHASPHKNQDGSISFYGYAYDATEFLETREAVTFANKFYTSVNDGVLLIDTNFNILRTNPAVMKMTGYSEEELKGKHASIIGGYADDHPIHNEIISSLTMTGGWKGELLCKRKNGELYTAQVSMEGTRHPDTGMIQNYILIYTDISALKEQKEEVHRLAKYDHLTNLPNRRQLLERLEEAIKETNTNLSKIAVCFIDLDNFKPVNDQYGHEIGDKFICALAKELQNAIRQQDIVARLGGDEFVVVLTELKNETQLQELIYHITQICSKKYRIDKEKIKISASIGIALHPDVKGGADELIRFATQAMYQAKKKGRNRFILFDGKTEEESVEHYNRLEKVKNALKNGQMTLWYQPKIHGQTNKVLGVEALIRWQLPDGKIIPAVEFIDIINGEELEYEVGKFVLDKALKEQKKWREKGVEIVVSVNISPNHLLRPDFIKDLVNLLRKYSSDPHMLIIEILETSQVSNFDVIIEKLKSCLKLGVGFSLDDFGTGYSSLGYLRALPAQEVKIDKSFILSMLTKPEDKMIVQGIIDLAHALGRIVVAEGVETDEHILELNKMGIDIIQGYGVSRPMPEKDLLSWISNWELNVKE